MNEVPFWFFLVRLPMDYQDREAIMFLASQVGKVDEETPNNGHITKMLEYHVRVWLNIDNPLPIGILVMNYSVKPIFVKFLYEYLPNQFYLHCVSPHHDIVECPRTRIPPPPPSTPSNTWLPFPHAPSFLIPSSKRWYPNTSTTKSLTPIKP